MGTIKRGFANNILTTGKFDATDLSGTIPSSNVANTTLSSITSVPASVGDLVQSVAADPSPVSAGDVWYNSTTGALKAGVLQAAAWASGGNLGNARSSLAGCGTQTAGLAFGGITTVITNVTEEYDGSAWTTGGNLGTSRYAPSGLGTQTAGLAAGGFLGLPANPRQTNTSEEYDGSAWTSGGNLGTARYRFTGAGVQTAGLVFGGSTSPGTVRTNVSEEYDGTSWSPGGNLNTTRNALAGAGTQTAGLAFGGFTTTTSNATEEYDGSVWTTSPGSLNTARGYLGGTGTQTAALGFGGNTPTISTATEQYDGTSWTNTSSLGNSMATGASAGTQTSALYAGSESSPKARTEEFVGVTVVANTVTTS